MRRRARVFVRESPRTARRDHRVIQPSLSAETRLIDRRSSAITVCRLLTSPTPRDERGRARWAARSFRIGNVRPTDPAPTGSFFPPWTQSGCDAVARRATRAAWRRRAATARVVSHRLGVSERRDCGPPLALEKMTVKRASPGCRDGKSGAAERGSSPSAIDD